MLTGGSFATATGDAVCGRARLPHRAGAARCYLLQIERVVDDASREAEEGQKHEPCRCYAHRERVTQKLPGRKAFRPAILEAETKEMLNARQSRFAAAATDLKPPRPRRPGDGASHDSPAAAWQDDRRRRSLSERAFEHETAAMKLGKSAHDRKSETGPIAGAAVSIVGLHERVAELGQVLLGDADAVIGDAEFDDCLGPRAPRRARRRRGR